MRGRITGSGLMGPLMFCVLVLTVSMMTALAPSASAFPYNNAIEGVNYGLQARAEAQSRALAKLLGYSLSGLRLEVGWARYEKEVPNALTGTNAYLNGPVVDSGTVYESGAVCQIALNKRFFESIRDAEEQNEVLAHEVFHCFEFEVGPDAHSDDDWILEGLARWADLTLYPYTHFAPALKDLSAYYSSPQTSLFKRSDPPSRGYDAVGFWAHVQDMTGDLWHRVWDVVSAGTYKRDQAALNAALPHNMETEFLDTWGSSAFDLSSGSTPDWRMRSPLDGRDYPTSHRPTSVDSSSTFTLKPWSTAQLEIGPGSSGPLIEIHLDQSVGARFGVSKNYVDSDITSRIFCSAADRSKCECPPEWSGHVPWTPLPSEPYLGAAADAIGGSVVTTYLTPENSGYCQPPKHETCGGDLIHLRPQSTVYCELGTPPALLGPRSCKNLLPGYNPVLEGEFKSLLAEHELEPPPTETDVDGNYNSFCFFEGYKGSVEDLIPTGGETPEKVFVGVIAIGTYTERTTSEAVAQQDFKIRADGVVGGAPAGVGEESKLAMTAQEPNPMYGYEECGSTAVVRVKNVIAGFGISGVAEEACGAAARDLLAAVAAEL